MSESRAATVVQSSWRGAKAREGARERRALQASGIASAVGGDKNARKPPGASASTFAAEVSRRPRVEGGIHGGTIRIVVRHVHFLRGVFLHVRVVSAANLLPMDSNGLSDPYVKVTLVDDDGTPYKKMIHRVPFEYATLDPEWDYSFYMGSADLDLRHTTIRFEIFDYDQWSADDAMGTASLPLRVFDADEQALIKRAARWRAKKEAEAKRERAAERERRASGSGSESSPGRASSPFPSLSPAFLPGMTRTKSAAAREKKEEEEWMSGAHDHEKIGGDLDDDDDDDDDDDGEYGNSRSGRRASAEKGRFVGGGGVFRGARRALGMTTEAKLGPLESVVGFGTAFNKERKQRGKTLRRWGVFGLDKPLVLQNGKRVGEMRWYTKQRVYGDLVVVHNDSYSRITQEASALLKQAGSIMSLATAGRAAKATGVGDFLSSKVEAACDTGKRRAVNLVESVLGETKQKLLDDLTKDRDMPGNVRKVFQTVVGVYFSEVQQEVMDEVARRLKTLSYSHNKKKGRRQRRDLQSTLLRIGMASWWEYFSFKYLKKLLLDFRAWVLYNELPYDKTFWGKLRSPGWWCILLTKLYSGWGIQAFLYAMRLAMIDRSDEWQLFEYISNFKGIQFLSGVLAMFQGVLMYMECAGLVSMDQPHTCDVNGPGMDSKAVCGAGVSNISCASVIGVGFFARILLTWYAFWLMRRSFSFGKPIFNDQRLVGAVIEIHEIRRGTKVSWAYATAMCKCLLDCGRGAHAVGKSAYRAALGIETTPLNRFRAAVNAVVENIKHNDPRWIQRNEGHHTVYVRAKVVAYSIKTGFHTIAYLDNAATYQAEQQEVNLQKKLFTVVTLKQMQPRRLQTLIFYYDLAVFALVILVVTRVITKLDLVRDDWQLFGLLYWIQCFYSVLAFPFVCIVIPGVQSLICHAKQTGYDEHGTLQAKFVRSRHDDGLDEFGVEEAPRSKYIPACYPFIQGQSKVKL